MKLFHGTYAAPSILEQGFNLALVGTNRQEFGALGIGVYMSESDETAAWYGNWTMQLAVPDEVIVDFVDACHRVGLDDIASQDKYELWENAKDRAFSERITTAMQAAGIQAVRLEVCREICVYNPSIIEIKDYYDNTYQADYD